MSRASTSSLLLLTAQTLIGLDLFIVSVAQALRPRPSSLGTRSVTRSQVTDTRGPRAP
jgi:hypothetical protein